MKEEDIELTDEQFIVAQEDFQEIWEQSGLQGYFDIMDKLENIGFVFDEYGDMIFEHDEILNDFLNKNEIPDVGRLTSKHMEELSQLIKN